MKKLAIMERANYKQFVQPEDTALQGCNRSAALNSNTAGRSGSLGLLWPATCGFDHKAKNPRGFGGLVPQGNKQTKHENPAATTLSRTPSFPIHAEPVQFQGKQLPISHASSTSERPTRS